VAGRRGTVGADIHCSGLRSASCPRRCTRPALTVLSALAWLTLLTLLALLTVLTRLHRLTVLVVLTLLALLAAPAVLTLLPLLAAPAVLTLLPLLTALAVLTLLPLPTAPAVLTGLALLAALIALPPLTAVVALSRLAGRLTWVVRTPLTTGAFRPWRVSNPRRNAILLIGRGWDRFVARAQDIGFPAPTRGSVHGTRTGEPALVDGSELAVDLPAHLWAAAWHRAVEVRG
jgi:hypothetical protein